jgi:PAS domain S-box-containing protein
MMLLVVGVTATTLLITENEVRASYQRHYLQSFRFQIDSFLQERQARLAPVQERLLESAAYARLIAAMENASQASAEQQDVDDLYQNAADQLNEIFSPTVAQASDGSRSNLQAGFFFFLNNQGEVLYPSEKVNLPFTFPGLQRLKQEIEAVGKSVAQSRTQQVGYLAPGQAAGHLRIHEMVFTPVTDQVKHEQLGILAVGFPLPAMDEMRVPPFDSQGLARGSSPILSGIWLDDQLYSTSIPAALVNGLNNELRPNIEARPELRSDFVVKVDGVRHSVYCQELNPGSAFPPAFQVCLYSQADAEAEERAFRQKILVSGTIALLGALALGIFISRGLAVPLQELVKRTTEIEHGNFAVKVPVRSRDEMGRLAVAFNDMTERIQASHAAQEQRIAERTQELIERRRTEEALRQSEASLREAQRIARLGNWHWTIPTNSLAWSDEIYAIFGISPKDFGATHETFLERVHPDDRELVGQAINVSIAECKPWSLDHRIVRPDGGERIVRQQAEVLLDKLGKTVGMVGTLQDITEQKKIEAEFLRAQRMDSIGALAGGMAHDLNNALSPILLGIQLIRRELSDPEARQMLSVMEANTYRGADMVRQVLTFARGRDGERELLEVGRIVREMEKIVRQTLPKSIAVASMVPSDLWPVLGNSTQIHQVLLNLCINARDAMPKGGQLTLAADNVEISPGEENNGHSQTAPGPYVMLLVSDTGTGIPEEALPHIFEPFFTTKPSSEGTGLGLSTVVRIVRNHGGFVSVKSDPGAGTTFEIYFPKAEAVAASSTHNRRVNLPRGDSETILLLEDDRSVREMVATSLVEYGYRVLSAANGDEALHQLDSHQQTVRVLLTNLAAPARNGASLLDQVYARVPGLPIIVMSGEAGSSGENQIAKAAFLPKPFSLEQLLTTIATELRRSR